MVSCGSNNLVYNSQFSTLGYWFHILTNKLNYKILKSKIQWEMTIKMVNEKEKMDYLSVPKKWQGARHEKKVKVEFHILGWNTNRLVKMFFSPKKTSKQIKDFLLDLTCRIGSGGANRDDGANRDSWSFFTILRPLGVFLVSEG